MKMKKQRITVMKYDQTAAQEIRNRNQALESTADSQSPDRQLIADEP